MTGRLLIARVLAAAALTALPLVAMSAPAVADAPTATGWWNLAAREGSPKPPSPPDVMPGDLLVQAGDPIGALEANPEAGAAPSAVAALRFAVPAGATVGAMTLEVADGATAMDVRAYLTLDAWKPVENGPLAQAPKADRSRFSQGVLDGQQLVFADIARLLPESGELSIVILPGAVDRVVIRKPAGAALRVTPAAGSIAAPSTDFSSPPSTGTGSQGSGFDPGGGTALPPGVSVVPDVVPGPAAPQPDVAAPVATSVPGPAVRAVSRTGSSLSPDDARTRYLAAAEAVLVLVTFGLFGWGPFARLAGTFGTASVPATTNASEAAVRGVGRFAQARSGKAIRL